MEHSTLDDDCFADLDEFADPAADALRAARKVLARATLHRGRINVRRASSEAALATLLPPCIEDGDSWHVISGGDIDSLSFAKHLLQHEVFDFMLLSTWCMALDDVKQLTQWLDAGQLQWLDCYTGEIFPSQYAVAYETLCSAVRRHKGRVATFRNHSKVILLSSQLTGRKLVIESSANVNTNPRTEQTAVTAAATLFDFYADFFSGIKSRINNFENWLPHECVAQPGPRQTETTPPTEATIHSRHIQLADIPVASSNTPTAPTLVLVRGAPGSGKSTIAKALALIGYCHFETDSYFERSGEYFFNPREISKANAWCLTRTKESIMRGERVVVANTFTLLAHLQPYIDIATTAGRTFQVVEAIGNWPNEHHVPDDAVKRMRAKFQQYLGVKNGQAT